MRDYSAIGLIPKKPGVYCLLGFSAKGEYAAYVGMGGNLHSRVSQHLEYRNSSVTTGASAVSLDVTQVCACQFWTHPSLEDKDHLAALELFAFEALNPVLRSRGGVSKSARALVVEPAFKEWAEILLNSDTGYVKFPSIKDLSRRISELEERLVSLERLFDHKE